MSFLCKALGACNCFVVNHSELQLLYERCFINKFISISIISALSEHHICCYCWERYSTLACRTELNHLRSPGQKKTNTFWPPLNPILVRFVHSVCTCLLQPCKVRMADSLGYIGWLLGPWSPGCVVPCKHNILWNNGDHETIWTQGTSKRQGLKIR